MVINGAKIRGLREKAGISRAELAEIAGVNASMISHIENNVRMTTVEVIKRIADKLGVAVDDLLNDRPATT